MEISQYEKRYNELAKRILLHCSVEHPDGNVFVSPFSVLMLLSLAARSTAGESREEILDFLNSYPGQDIASTALIMFQKMLSRSKGFTSANAVCVRQDYARTIKEKYVELVLHGCNGQLFTSGNMLEDVNRWAEKTTKGMIKSIMPETLNGALFCLQNAVAFEAAWECPVQDRSVSKRIFYNADGTKSHVQMLYSSEDLYTEDERFTGFVKPYEKSEFVFMALLPRRKDDLLKNLQKIDFTGLYNAADWNDVHIHMPEFSFDYSMDLEPFCMKEGISEIWTPQADFSPLSGAWLKMDAIMHHASIEVSRTGTRAAAYTIGMIGLGSLPPTRFKEVNLNRPFLFAILHSKTGFPVFTGIVNHLPDETTLSRSSTAKDKSFH